MLLFIKTLECANSPPGVTDNLVGSGVVVLNITWDNNVTRSQVHLINSGLLISTEPFRTEEEERGGILHMLHKIM